MKFILITILFFSVPLVSTTQTEDNLGYPKKITTVIIDPGHGGKDPGAISPNGIKEKDLNLQISFKLKEFLENNYRDLNVVMTREDDRFIELLDRGKIANENNGNLFISIHCNSKLPTEEAKTGFEIYLLDPVRLEKAKEITAAQNTFLNELGYAPEDSVSKKVLSSLYEFSFYKNEERFASILQTEMLKGTSLTSRGVKQEPFIVLYGASMPAVLIECGFLTNENDENYLTSENGQYQLANSIYKAVRFFKMDYDFENNFY
jgi:N-acetylmuramoyl-L-alanine amidase